MRTITIDIINEKVLSLLQGLEQLKLIRLRKDISDNQPKVNWLRYKGSLSKQSLDDVDQQLNDLRSEWE